MIENCFDGLTEPNWPFPSEQLVDVFLEIQEHLRNKTVTPAHQRYMPVTQNGSGLLYDNGWLWHNNNRQTRPQPGFHRRLELFIYLYLETDNSYFESRHCCMQGDLIVRSQSHEQLAG